MNSDRVIESFP